MSSEALLRDEAEDRAQILQIKQQQALLIRDAKRDIEHPFLYLVETKQPRQQQRPHLRNRGADRMALLAEKVPEHHRKFVDLIVDAEFRRALDECLLGLTHRGQCRPDRL